MFIARNLPNVIFPLKSLQLLLQPLNQPSASSITKSQHANNQFQLLGCIFTSIYLNTPSCSRILSFSNNYRSQLASKKKKANQLFSVGDKPHLSVCPPRGSSPGVSAKWAALCVGSCRAGQTVLVSGGFRLDVWLLLRPQARAHRLPCDLDISILLAISQENHLLLFFLALAHM